MAKPFYRYTDDDGEVHIVDALDRVPADHRDDAEPVRLGEATVFFPKRYAQDATPVANVAPPSSPGHASSGLLTVDDLHWPSFLGGLGVATLLFGALAVIRSRRFGGVAQRLLTVGAFGAVGVLVVVAYLGGLRRAAGLDDGATATPQQLIDDARQAAQQVKARLQKQESIMKKTEEQSP